MEKFKMWLIRFMAGRYGADQLTRAMMWVYIAVAVAGIFFKPLYLLALALLMLMFFRIFSKNIAKRYAENQKYLQLTGKLKGRFTLQKRKWNDRKTHRYRACPHCKATLRLPYKKGKHNVRCPKCHKEFEVKI